MLSDGMINTLVQNTIDVKTSAPEGLAAWRENLQQSIQFATQMNRTDEEAFLEALVAIVDEQDVHLVEDNPYYPHMVRVQAAIANFIKPDVDYTKLFDTITAMYKYAGAASLRELLRRAGASEKQIEVILEQIKKSENTVLLYDQIDIIVETSIEVKTTTPEKLRDWRTKIAQALQIAKEDGNQKEQAFFEALLNILDDKKVSLEENNPYFGYLELILNGIRHGLLPDNPLAEPEPSLPVAEAQAEPSKREENMTKLSNDMIEVMVKTTIAVKTIALADLEDWRNNIIKSIDLAAQNDRMHDQHFFRALLGILNDEDVLLPDGSPYKRHLKRVVDGIEEFAAGGSQEQQAISSFASLYQEKGETALREKLYKSGASEEQSDAIVDQIMKVQHHTPKTTPMLPRILVDSMVQTTIRVRTQSLEKLKDWRAELQRNMESAVINKKADAHIFFKTLLELLKDANINLPTDNPYYAQLKQVQDAFIAAQEATEPDTVEAPSEVEEVVLEKEATEQDVMSEEEWLGWLEQNTLAVMTVSAVYLDEWKEVLQNEMMNSKHPVSDPKITFLAALYNLVHNRLPALDALNPYYPNWQNVLIQLSRFKSGRRMKPDFLDKIVQSTIAVCTTDIDGNEAWRIRLKKLNALAVGRQDHQEEDLFQALLDICEGRLPSITFDNPYMPELQRIQAEVASFHTKNRKEFEANQIEKEDKTIFNPRAVKVESLPEPIRSEIKGLLDALDVALAKVPEDFKNDTDIVREEIGRAIDEATKNQPDLKRLKIRGDSLRVAAGNLQNISPIINQLAALLLRLGD